MKESSKNEDLVSKYFYKVRRAVTKKDFSEMIRCFNYDQYKIEKEVELIISGTSEWIRQNWPKYSNYKSGWSGNYDDNFKYNKKNKEYNQNSNYNQSSKYYNEGYGNSNAYNEISYQDNQYDYHYKLEKYSEPDFSDIKGYKYNYDEEYVNEEKANYDSNNINNYTRNSAKSKNNGRKSNNSQLDSNANNVSANNSAVLLNESKANKYAGKKNNGKSGKGYNNYYEKKANVTASSTITRIVEVQDTTKKDVKNEGTVPDETENDFEYENEIFIEPEPHVEATANPLNVEPQKNNNQEELNSLRSYFERFKKINICDAKHELNGEDYLVISHFTVAISPTAKQDPIEHKEDKKEITPTPTPTTEGSGPNTSQKPSAIGFPYPNPFMPMMPFVFPQFYNIPQYPFIQPMMPPIDFTNQKNGLQFPPIIPPFGMFFPFNQQQQPLVSKSGPDTSNN